MASPLNLQEIQDNFSLLEDWEDKYAYLIDLGKLLPPMKPEDKVEKYKIKGCVSQVWLKTCQKEGLFHLSLGSDALIVQGLCTLVYAAYDEKAVEEISQIDLLSIFKEIGLEKNLSPNRRHGFFALLETLKNQAES